MTEDTQKKLQQLSMLEQNLQGFVMQKQELQGRLSEVQSAHEALEQATESHRIIGNILVKQDPKVLREELHEELAGLKSRISTLDEQEKKLRERTEKLQEELLKDMKNDS